MVRPTCFYSNPETIVDNKFMAHMSNTDEVGAKNHSTSKAQAEFDLLVDKIRHSGVDVRVRNQQRDDLPDSVFPNNWFSTHRDARAYPGGLFVTYPMKTPSREAEKNPTIIDELKKEYEHEIDLKASGDAVLEGTGVLIFDKGDA